MRRGGGDRQALPARRGQGRVVWQLQAGADQVLRHGHGELGGGRAGGDQEAPRDDRRAPREVPQHRARGGRPAAPPVLQWRAPRGVDQHPAQGGARALERDLHGGRALHRPQGGAGHAGAARGGLRGTRRPELQLQQLVAPRCQAGAQDAPRVCLQRARPGDGVGGDGSRDRHAVERDLRLHPRLEALRPARRRRGQAVRARGEVRAPPLRPPHGDPVQGVHGGSDLCEAGHRRARQGRGRQLLLRHELQRRRDGGATGHGGPRRQARDVLAVATVQRAAHPRRAPVPQPAAQEDHLCQAARAHRP
ncbi:MAG: hypothetical protein CL844_03870 [Crocinitomicaceae bacterium]|nr:hypothetical protein [Crocinitomicaceae bacterium]